MSEFITFKEAAVILDRSYANVRELAIAGYFEQKQEREGRRIRTVVRRSDVVELRRKRDAAAAQPKTKTAEFPIKRESMGFADWIVGQAIAGLCANPAYMNPETSDDSTIAGLVETACDIARRTLVSRGVDPLLDQHLIGVPADVFDAVSDKLAAPGVARDQLVKLFEENADLVRSRASNRLQP